MYVRYLQLVSQDSTIDFNHIIIFFNMNTHIGTPLQLIFPYLLNIFEDGQIDNSRLSSREHIYSVEYFSWSIFDCYPCQSENNKIESLELEQNNLCHTNNDNFDKSNSMGVRKSFIRIEYALASILKVNGDTNIITFELI